MSNENITFSGLTVTTMVCTTSADIENLDLYSIYEYLRIDHKVIGVKYLSKNKGKISKTVSFYNQMSIVYFIDNKLINIKVFSNGKFQLTGITDTTQVIRSLKDLMSIFETIKGHKKILVSEMYNEKTSCVITKLDDRLIGYTTSEDICNDDHCNNIGSFIGDVKHDTKRICKDNNVYDKNDMYLIKGLTLVLFENKFFVMKNHLNKVKKMYDTNGNYIGEQEYIFTHKKKNLALKGIKLINEKILNSLTMTYDVINSFDRALGILQLNFIDTKYLQKFYGYINYNDASNGDNTDNVSNTGCKDSTTFKTRNKEITIKYNAVTRREDRTDLVIEALQNNLKIVNMNSNFKIVHSSGHIINRQSVFELFKNEYKLTTEYDPYTYSGVRIKYFFDDGKELGQRDNCTTDDLKDLTKVTIIVFQTGRILISGARSMEETKFIFNYIQDVFRTHTNSIFVNKISKDVTGTSITIWELFNLM